MHYRFNSTFRVKDYRRSPLRSRSGFIRLTPHRETSAERRWKLAVRERDDYTCQYPNCGYCNKHIDVHHIAKRSQRPDLKLEMSNGICLCRKHHRWTDLNHDQAVAMGLLNLETYEAAQKMRREA